jgi:hypothetical protein
MRRETNPRASEVFHGQAKFRKSPPTRSQHEKEDPHFAGKLSLGVTSNEGPTNRRRHSPYGRDAARVFRGSVPLLIRPFV